MLITSFHGPKEVRLNLRTFSPCAQSAIWAKETLNNLGSQLIGGEKEHRRWTACHIISVTVRSVCRGDQRRGGDESVGDVIHHDAEAFERAQSQQVQIGGFGEDDFVGGFVALGAEDGAPSSVVEPNCFAEVSGWRLKSKTPRSPLPVPKRGR